MVFNLYRMLLCTASYPSILAVFPELRGAYFYLLLEELCQVTNARTMARVELVMK